MGQTVNEILTGHKRPLSNAEFVEWVAFYNVRASKEKQQASKGRRRR